MIFKRKSNSSKLDLLKNEKSDDFESGVTDIIISNETHEKINQIESNHESDPKLLHPRIQILTRILQNNKIKKIVPYVDFNKGQITYPILEQIGESSENISYLDDLVEKNLLEKEIQERLVVCPIHKNSFSTTVRLSCPKCASFEIEKLNLFEHIKCGFISENRSFVGIKDSLTHCPSCKKEIKNFEKEIRIPALWYQCDRCNEKFDNIALKLYCRSHDHDFDITSAQFVSLYDYRLKESSLSLDLESIKIQDFLQKIPRFGNYVIMSNSQIKGKTGNLHQIPLSINYDEKLVLVFFKHDTKKLLASDYNSIIISVLDINPFETILITKSECDEKIKLFSKTYGISTIQCVDDNAILDFIKSYLQKLVNPTDS